MVRATPTITPIGPAYLARAAEWIAKAEAGPEVVHPQRANLTATIVSGGAFAEADLFVRQRDGSKLPDLELCRLVLMRSLVESGLGDVATRQLGSTTGRNLAEQATRHVMSQVPLLHGYREGAVDVTFVRGRAGREDLSVRAILQVHVKGIAGNHGDLVRLARDWKFLGACEALAKKEGFALDTTAARDAIKRGARGAFTSLIVNDPVGHPIADLIKAASAIRPDLDLTALARDAFRAFGTHAEPALRDKLTARADAVITAGLDVEKARDAMASLLDRRAEALATPGTAAWADAMWERLSPPETAPLAEVLPHIGRVLQQQGGAPAPGSPRHDIVVNAFAHAAHRAIDDDIVRAGFEDLLRAGFGDLTVEADRLYNFGQRVRLDGAWAAALANPSLAFADSTSLAEGVKSFGGVSGARINPDAIPLTENSVIALWSALRQGKSNPAPGHSANDYHAASVQLSSKTGGGLAYRVPSGAAVYVAGVDVLPALRGHALAQTPGWSAFVEALPQASRGIGGMLDRTAPLTRGTLQHALNDAAATALGPKADKMMVAMFTSIAANVCLPHFDAQDAALKDMRLFA